MTVFERLKKENIYPWEVELVEDCDDLIEDNYITEEEKEEILKTENLHEFLQDFYKDFRPKVEVPENVKQAYETAKKYYDPVGICWDLIYRICDYWCDDADVLYSWIDTFTPVEDGVLSLYLCDKE